MPSGGSEWVGGVNPTEFRSNQSPKVGAQHFAALRDFYDILNLQLANFSLFLVLLNFPPFYRAKADV